MVNLAPEYEDARAAAEALGPSAEGGLRRGRVS